MQGSAHSVAASGSSKSARLFRGVLTSRLTGHVRSVPARAGCSSVQGFASASPSHAGQSSGSRITGMRLYSSTTSVLASVVTMVKVRVIASSGLRQSSQRPANATGWPSCRAIA